MKAQSTESRNAIHHEIQGSSTKPGNPRPRLPSLCCCDLIVRDHPGAGWWGAGAAWKLVRVWGQSFESHALGISTLAHV